ncbi:hypothetical protein DFH05DRAFT_878790 [Lentinula detonsa]|uniref:WW domain-containing protein n=1 Tax=Lentinula detonsa TaxID=2804962 RepID=A0A9W8P717_9AGAR|nr:hypothetical protein DFH05DRAFT_878790 [Lentinula detonsa]
MDDDVLDWDDGEDQLAATTGPIDDADGVSLGSDSGDENENAAPPVEEASASTRIASPSAQGVNGTSRPASPKLSTPLQRKDSSSSLRTTKPINSVSVDSPKTQNRSQRSKSKILTSAQMMMHGLPPKPVTSAVSFLPSSQSSLTEATAMVTRETAKGKGGGGITKTSAANPLHKDDVGSLPPHWEIRHPRSGGKQIYFYNNQTHESTWTHPSLLQSPRGHPSDSAHSAQGSLSHQDRYYRPGDRRDVSPGDANERIRRYPSPSPAARSSRSPSRDRSPYTNHRRRSISAERGRDSGRGRPPQPISPKEYDHANRDRDTSQTAKSDRRWSPSSAKDFEDLQLRHSQRQRMQDYPHEDYPYEARMRDTRHEHEQPVYGKSVLSRRNAREDRKQDEREALTHNPIYSTFISLIQSYPSRCALAQSALYEVRKNRLLVSCSGHVALQISSCFRLHLSSFSLLKSRTLIMDFFFFLIVPVPSVLHVTLPYSLYPLLSP